MGKRNKVVGSVALGVGDTRNHYPLALTLLQHPLNATVQLLRQALYRSKEYNILRNVFPKVCLGVYEGFISRWKSIMKRIYINYIAISILALFGLGLIGSFAFAQSSPACPKGTVCNGTCTATSIDEFNCGSCGNVCPLGKACINGTCACLPGQTLCNGTCIDTRFNEKSCGACGKICPPGLTCNDGVCGCPLTFTACNGTCVDITLDQRNCGSCGNVCPQGLICIGGTCEDASSAY